MPDTEKLPQKSAHSMPRKPPPKTAVPPPPNPADEPLPSTNPAVPDHLTPEQSVAYPIVAVGASAGGLEAFKLFLASLPTDTGMAFVLIQHLDPSHESMLTAILSRSTSMAVREVKHNMPVRPNHVFVIPPGTNLVFSHGLLQLAPRTEQRGQHRPVDHFMRALAEEHGYKSIGVILSGTASDGTLGMQEIKTAGGITFAQDDSAEQEGMPHSAIASGAVDFVLAPGEIARELGRIASHPLVAPAEGDLESLLARQEGTIRRVVELLRDSFGVDFTSYKRNTLNRRITRRVLLNRLTGLDEYLKVLRTTPTEAQALYHDILINVTSFFRNPESFDALKADVFPRIAAKKSRNDVLRVWTLGCSTGEEAYSLAMAYTEFAEAAEVRLPMQIFATDVNGVGIEKARSGIYPRGITQDLTPERLKRFFVETDGSYRVIKPIRDMCVFARQNVLVDPPFSRMDLIGCRNLLIYLEPVLQQKLIPLLHYSLNPNGVLWLGASETIGANRDLFQLAEQRHKFYHRLPASRRATVTLPRGRVPALEHALAREAGEHPTAVAQIDPQKEADRLVLSRYGPPGVVVDAQMEVVQFRGDTSAYLRPAAGRASLNLLKMLREGLLTGVRGAVTRSLREETLVREEGLHLRTETGIHDVTVVVMPLRAGDGRALVLFEESREPAKGEAEPIPATARGRSKEVERLRAELAATREYLQSVIEQQEAANEELQAANEEVLSTNEELQSVNEELETSKEEIESTNEEISTVNEELNQRNLDLAQSTNDLANLLGSVDMPIVLLDRNRRIRRFTPAAATALNLIGTDVGRPLRDFNLPPDMRELDDLLGAAVERNQRGEREVRDHGGRWHLMRVQPYRTDEQRTEGAVLALVDIDAIKRSVDAVAESENRFHVLADSAPVLIWVNDLGGSRFVNRAFEEFVGIPESQVRDTDWASFVHSDDRERFMDTYRRAFTGRGAFEAIARFRRSDGVYRWTKSIGVPRFTDAGEFLGYVGSTVDIGDLKDAEESLRDADRAKNEFLGTLGHELRNPLAAMRNALYLLAPVGRQDGTTGHALAVIERQMGNMVRIVDDLLDVSRITHGKIQLHAEAVDLVGAVRHSIDATEHERSRAGQAVTTTFPDDPLWVEADPARLDQILGNLLGNASKFTPEGGHIEVRIERAPARPGAPLGEAVMRIIDDGVGIEPEMLPRIFDLFVQGPRSALRMRSGVGIGLTLARRLVEMHGGSIEATSDGPSRGSEFTVRLPVSPPPSEHPHPVVAREPPPRVNRILVVDDNRDAADGMRGWLAEAGEDVRIAYDGAAALDVAREFRPQVVFLDIGLPDMSGYEVARKLRAMPGTEHVLLIAITGFGRPEDVALSREAGFDDHVTKPAEPERVLGLIGRLAARIEGE